jgi:hypothetical protein
MPIAYEVHQDGHFIHAVASGVLTGEEFVQYEIDHAKDERIKVPLSELLEIPFGAFKELTEEDVEQVLLRRKTTGSPPTPHRCAIVVPYADGRAWNLAKFYEGMVSLHFPESVIVFGDPRIAKIWLGVEDALSDERASITGSG